MGLSSCDYPTSLNPIFRERDYSETQGDGCCTVQFFMCGKHGHEFEVVHDVDYSWIVIDEDGDVEVTAKANHFFKDTMAQPSDMEFDISEAVANHLGKNVYNVKII